MRFNISILAWVAASWCTVASESNAQLLEFPMRANDLEPGERLSTGNHGGGIQDFALDIDVLRHAGNGVWHAFENDPPANFQDA